MTKLVALWAALTISVVYAEDFKMEEFISEKKILQSKEKLTKSLPDKRGYKGSKIWAVLGKYAAKNRDIPLMDAFFSKIYAERNQQVTYRFDLLEIFKYNPDFFVDYMRQSFGGHDYCLAWLFDRDNFMLQEKHFAPILANKKTSQEIKQLVRQMHLVNISREKSETCQDFKLEIVKKYGKSQKGRK